MRPPTVPVLALLFIAASTALPREADGGEFAGSGGIYGGAPSPGVSLGSDAPIYLFNGGELQLDLFYLNIDGDDFDGNHGYGIGLNYYLGRYLGVMFEGFQFEDSDESDGNLTGAVLFRLPIDQSAFAVYAFAGAGYQFGYDQWSLNLGGGIDVRLTYHLSGFFDARFWEPEATDSSAAIMRVGLRVIF